MINEAKNVKKKKIEIPVKALCDPWVSAHSRDGGSMGSTLVERLCAAL